MYVLDDGKRDQLEEYIQSRRTKPYVYCHYIARPKLPGVPHHAKAGNINHTLHYIYDEGKVEKPTLDIDNASVWSLWRPISSNLLFPDLFLAFLTKMTLINRLEKKIFCRKNIPSVVQKSSSLASLILILSKKIFFITGNSRFSIFALI